MIKFSLFQFENKMLQVFQTTRYWGNWTRIKGKKGLRPTGLEWPMQWDWWNVFFRDVKVLVRWRPQGPLSQARIRNINIFLLRLASAHSWSPGQTWDLRPFIRKKIIFWKEKYFYFYCGRGWYPVTKQTCLVRKK